MSGLHDQQYINENKHKLITQTPLTYFKWCHYYNNHKNLDPLIIHFNYVIGSKKRN